GQAEVSSGQQGGEREQGRKGEREQGGGGATGLEFRVYAAEVRHCAAGEKFSTRGYFHTPTELRAVWWQSSRCDDSPACSGRLRGGCCMPLISLRRRTRRSSPHRV